MSTSLLGFSHIIVNITFHILMHHVMEDSGHSSLVGNTNILEPKWHHFPIEGPPCTSEGYFLLIFRCNLDLVLAGETIHDRVHFIACSHIHYHVYVWKWKIILRAYLIKIFEVNTYTNGFIMFWNKYNVGNPFYIVNSSNNWLVTPHERAFFLSFI